MASLTLADAASRTGAMSEVKKPKRWMPKAPESAAPAREADKPAKSGSLAKSLMAVLHKHTAASKGSLYKNRD